MSTRSTISMTQKDDTVKAIYCHWDGYRKHVGNMLIDHYSSNDRLAELMALGDLSSLHESMEPVEGLSLNSRPGGHCIVFGRDGGYKDTEAKVYPSYEHRMSVFREEYNYHWNGHKWLHQHTDSYTNKEQNT